MHRAAYRVDLREIHLYFSRHRSGRPIDFLQLQIALGTAVAFLALLQHYRQRVAPGLSQSFTLFDPWAVLPYALLLVGVRVLWRFSMKVARNYEDLRQESPGRDLGKA